MSGKVAVVTGANRGIGYAIARKLCKVFDGTVLLTARDSSNGVCAINELEKQGLKCKFHPLDITNDESIQSLRSHLLSAYGGVDAVVNNAGIAFKNASLVPFAEQAELTLKTNFCGTLSMCKAMSTILKPNARIVNITSSLGILTQINEDLQQRFSSPDTTIEDICKLTDEFIRHVNEGDHKEHGWSNTAYGISQVAIIAMTKSFARDISKNGPEGVLVNACCPGWVKTDMAGQTAPDTLEEGADSPVYFATLPVGLTEPHGELVKKRKLQDWKTINRYH